MTTTETSLVNTVENVIDKGCDTTDTGTQQQRMSLTRDRI